MGMLYQRGNIWWIKYYINGRPVRESAGTKKETEARRILKDREGRVATGQPMLPRVDRIRYEEAAQDLRQHYEVTGQRNLEEAEYRLAHLDCFFASQRIAGIGPANATAYAQKRQTEEASNGTINRELAILNRMLRLAYENGKLLRLPMIRQLEEAPPRAGFFEREQFEAVRYYLRPDLQVVVTVAYTFGWRMQSEVLSLELRQVDLEAGTIRLDPGQAKNDEGRIVYLTPELRGLLRAQVDRVMDLMRSRSAVIPYLFPHLMGRFQGQRIRDFRKAWASACKKSGCRGMLRHDFRRTAVRNLERSSVSRSVAMKVTGHKTESVYRRYAIVNDADLQEATRKLAGTISGTVGISRLDGQSVNG
ncbi:MAG: site-specific integrase [Candidatus Rokubacteria bacterium]|nr:site-specific integrase [Candidatus Rokubacteria bacterium]